MIACATPDEPNVNWTLAQLEDFIHASLKRTATDAWRTGKALKLARRKVRQAGKQTWTAWKRSNGYSDTMVSRYIRLFEAYETTDSLGDMGVIEACEKAGILEPRGKASRRPEDNPPAGAGKPFAWAVGDENDEHLLACVTFLDDGLAGLFEAGDTKRLQEFVEMPDLRVRVESLIRRLDALLALAVAERPMRGCADSTSKKGARPTLAV